MYKNNNSFGNSFAGSSVFVHLLYYR